MYISLFVLGKVSARKYISPGMPCHEYIHCPDSYSRWFYHACLAIGPAIYMLNKQSMTDPGKFNTARSHFIWFIFPDLVKIGTL